MTEEARLIEKLQRIEALFAGTATQDEREAAALARDRIRNRFNRYAARSAAVCYRGSMDGASGIESVPRNILGRGNRRESTLMPLKSSWFLNSFLWLTEQAGPSNKLRRDCARRTVDNSLELLEVASG
jgi:hypothetical protein